MNESRLAILAAYVTACPHARCLRGGVTAEFIHLMNPGGHKMHEGEASAKAAALLTGPPRVINVGLELFAENLASQGAQVVHVRWSPPAGGNPELAGLLARLRS